MPIPGEMTTLRIRYPKTVDGRNLAVNEEGNTIWEETELPLTAREAIETENKNLPFHLRKKIDVLHYHNAPPPEQVVKGVGVEMLKTVEPDKSESDEILKLKARIAELEKEAVNGTDLLGTGEGSKKAAGRPRKELV